MSMPVTVYAFAFTDAQHDHAQYCTWLDTEERARLAAFLDPADAARYLVAHGVLRQILGHRLALAPAQVPITRTANGQPVLAGAAGASGIRFNLTHGHQHGLVAIGENVAVGVDLEDGSAPADLLSAARLVLTGAEYAHLLALPAPWRTLIFFVFWVRKEAVLKALGTGFFIDPRTVDVLNTNHIHAGGRYWHCIDLSNAPALGAINCTAPAALAIEKTKL